MEYAGDICCVWIIAHAKEIHYFDTHWVPNRPICTVIEWSKKLLRYRGQSSAQQLLRLFSIVSTTFLRCCICRWNLVKVSLNLQGFELCFSDGMNLSCLWGEVFTEWHLLVLRIVSASNFESPVQDICTRIQPAQKLENGATPHLSVHNPPPKF